jgi:hypothetical protein
VRGNSDASVHSKPFHVEGAVIVFLEHTEPVLEEGLGCGWVRTEDVVKQSAG